jgi:hypothetical protein
MMTLIMAPFMMLLCTPVFAQSKGGITSPAQPAPSTMPASSTTPDVNTTYIFGSVGAFIPGKESYRLNFSNSFMGLPIEVSGGLLFPISSEIFVPFTLRYDRRTANFVTGMTMSVVSIEPGVRYFFQREHGKEFRLFGGVEGILADASVSGSYEASQDGTITGTVLAQRDYFNIGIGFDLGLMYPLTPTTALEAIVHLSSFFASSVASGGLGNIGGISISADYRFGF